ncbi:hypothetical protein G6F31_017778 [Rhizopus arrhizus]|nr:hypothetical protein G6F31_017778 [Rhizopus arrhizus]
MQRFGHADAGHQAQPGQAAEATGVQAQHRQVDVRGQRRGPGTATTAAATAIRRWWSPPSRPPAGRAAAAEPRQAGRRGSRPGPAGRPVGSGRSPRQHAPRRPRRRP